MALKRGQVRAVGLGKQPYHPTTMPGMLEVLEISRYLDHKEFINGIIAYIMPDKEATWAPNPSPCARQQFTSCQTLSLEQLAFVTSLYPSRIQTLTSTFPSTRGALQYPAPEGAGRNCTFSKFKNTSQAFQEHCLHGPSPPLSVKGLLYRAGHTFGQTCSSRCAEAFFWPCLVKHWRHPNCGACTGLT